MGLFIVQNLSLLAQEEAITKEEYLLHCETTAQHYISDLDGWMKKWRDAVKPNKDAGYRPTTLDIHLASLCANLAHRPGSGENSPSEEASWPRSTSSFRAFQRSTPR